MKEIIRFFSPLFLMAFLALDVFGTEESSLLKGEYGGFTLTVLTSTNSVFPYEPVGVIAVLKNPSKDARLAKAAWSGDAMVVSYRRAENSAEWREVIPRMRGTPVPLVERSFEPGASVTWQEVVALDTAGSYEMKVSAGYRFEAIVRVTVRQPLGREGEALNYLIDHQLVHFVGASLQPQHAAYTANTTEALDQFARTYSDSYYGHLAQLCLGVAWMKQIWVPKTGAGIDSAKANAALNLLDQKTRGEVSRVSVDYRLLERTSDLAKANRYLTTATAAGSPTIEGWALYYLSAAARSGGQQDKAEEFRQKLLASTADPYLRHLAEGGEK